MKGQLGFSNNFVGREVELNRLRQLVQNPYGKIRVLFILGDGGVGKTLLTNRMLRELGLYSFLRAEESIDLFYTDYRYIDGIQWKIKEIVENLPELKGQPTPFADFVKGRTNTSEIFYECLKKFCADHPLALAFDSFENLDTVASEWLFKGGPDGLQVPGLICIVASRYEKADLENYRKNSLVEEIRLSGFTLEETEVFYRSISDEIKISAIDPFEDLFNAIGLSRDNSVFHNIEWLRKLTGGKPLMLEMAFRWLGSLLDSKSLEGSTPNRLEEKLMMQVSELAALGQLDAGPGKQVSQPVFDTLVCMSQITRRFDNHFLQYLLDKKQIWLDDPKVSEKDIVENLEKYFFVKVRLGNKGEQVLQLHEEMARLVKMYVWPFLDPSGEKRQELLRVVDEYYDQLIAEHVREEADVLLVEKLYYALQRDWKEDGKRLWFELTEFENENINKLLLVEEIKGYIREYDVETQYEINRRIAQIESEAHNFNQAIGYWERVKKLGEAEARDDWIVVALIGKFNASWQVDPEKALNNYLVPAKRLAGVKAPEKTACVYYEIGFAYRQMQDMKKAIQWYERAIREFQAKPQDNALEATIRNDAGYTYAQLGQWGDATKYLNTALDIREASLLGINKRLENEKAEEPYVLKRLQSKASIRVGLSHNTLGEFHRHAEDLDEALTHYDKAYEIFERENHYYWQAKSLGGRGETYRRLGLQAKKRNNQADYKKYVQQARLDMEKCLYLCEKYQLADERDTAYRRLGRLSHDFALAALEHDDKKASQKHLEEAQNYFMHGLKFAQATREVLEEFENLTELAFLLDDAIEAYGKSKVPARYSNALIELEEALRAHKDDLSRIYQYPVFAALLKLEQGAVALSNDEHTKALNRYLAGYKELGTLPGYGAARYKQHFSHLTRQIEELPRNQQVRWCKKFIETWQNTPVPGRRGKMLADDLIPDLVQWCNRLLIAIDY